MQLNQLKRIHKNKRTQAVGRGGKRGKTSGRGTKGQKARSGHKMRPEIRDIIKKMPRLRGRGKHQLKSIVHAFFVVNVGDLDRSYEKGESVNKETLIKKGLVDSVSRDYRVKILGGGSISKNLMISECSVSEKAKVLIEKAGGKIA